VFLLAKAREKLLLVVKATCTNLIFVIYLCAHCTGYQRDNLVKVLVYLLPFCSYLSNWTL